MEEIVEDGHGQVQGGRKRKGLELSKTLVKTFKRLKASASSFLSRRWAVETPTSAGPAPFDGWSAEQTQELVDIVANGEWWDLDNFSELPLSARVVGKLLGMLPEDANDLFGDLAKARVQSIGLLLSSCEQIIETEIGFSAEGALAPLHSNDLQYLFNLRNPPSSS